LIRGNFAVLIWVKGGGIGLETLDASIVFIRSDGSVLMEGVVFDLVLFSELFEELD
jgi:hypothetical protein